MTAGASVRRRAYIDLAGIRSTATSAGVPLPDCAADLRVDAYGHGLVPVARALTDAGIGGFLVSRVEDAAALADDGIPVPAVVATAGSLPTPTTLLGPELFGL